MTIFGDSYNDRKIQDDGRYQEERFQQEIQDPSVAALVERLYSKASVSAEDIKTGKARGGRIAEIARDAETRMAEQRVVSPSARRRP